MNESSCVYICVHRKHGIKKVRNHISRRNPGEEFDNVCLNRFPKIHRGKFSPTQSDFQRNPINGRIKVSLSDFSSSKLDSNIIDVDRKDQESQESIFRENIGDIVKGAIESLNEKVDKITNDREKKAVRVIDAFIERKAEKIIDLTDNKIKEIQEITDNNIKEIVNNSVKEIDEIIGNRVKEVDEIVGNRVKEVDEIIGNRVKEVNEIVNNHVGEVDEIIGNRVKEVDEIIGNRVKEVDEIIGNRVKEVDEIANNNVKEVDEIIGNRVKEVDEIVNNHVKKAGEIVDNHVKEVEKKLDEITDSHVKEAERLVEKRINDVINNQSNSITENVNSIISRTFDDRVESVVDSINNIINNTVEIGLSNIEKIFSDKITSEVEQQTPEETLGNPDQNFATRVPIHLTSGLMGTLRLVASDAENSANYMVLGPNSITDHIKNIGKDSGDIKLTDLSGSSILLGMDGRISSFVCMLENHENPIPNGKIIFEIWISRDNKFEIIPDSYVEISTSQNLILGSVEMNAEVKLGDLIFVTVRFLSEDEEKSFIPKSIKSTIIIN